VKGREEGEREEEEREEVRVGSCFECCEWCCSLVGEEEAGKQLTWVVRLRGRRRTNEEDDGQEKKEKKTTSDLSPSRLNEHKIDSNREKQHYDEK
jgi:hypothetical protein